MTDLLLNSGLSNPALWFAVVAAVGLLAGGRSWLNPPLRRVGFAVLIAGCSATLFVGLYRSYAVPRDVMQDIVAAQEFAAGRPMHPADMNAKIRAALDAEGPRGSLLWWHPQLAGQEQRQREAMLNEHWVQAHPPLATVLTAPVVSTVGVLGTQAVFAVLNLLALAITLALAEWKFGVSRWTVPAGAVFVAAFGWSSVVSSVRLQQLSLPLIGLLAGGWVFLRRGREGRAGVCVGLAACLKIIPGVLLLALLVRHRRGFLSAAITAAACAAYLFAVVPWSDLAGYRATTAGVIHEYAGYDMNISLLGVFARCGGTLGAPLPAMEAAWVATVAALALGWGYMMLHHPRPSLSRRAVCDFDWAIGLCLMPLLSPVAWDHYEVFLLLPLLVLGNHVRDNAGRRGRVGLAVAVLLIALPDATFILIDNTLRKHGLGTVSVWLVLPIRATVSVFLAGWLAHLSWHWTTEGLTVNPRVPAAVGVAS